MRAHSGIAALVQPRETAPREEDFTDALLTGLRATPKNIPCKYFYDVEGSLLFEKICMLPEYYPTRTELRLLHASAHGIAQFIGPDAEIVGIRRRRGRKDKTVARCHGKSARLFADGYFRTLFAEHRGGTAGGLSGPRHPADRRGFHARFSLPPSSGRRVGFFPGSTIGNFAPGEARAFLANVARMLKGGGLLIGVDLVKDPQILHAAYNDKAGITAAFNKNLLARANREAGANFNLAHFSHYALYNPLLRRIEMYLISACDQRVTVCGRSIAFAEGEAIHTEYSHKYTVDGFKALAASAGFIPRQVWCDADRLFSIHWLETK